MHINKTRLHIITQNPNFDSIFQTTPLWFNYDKEKTTQHPMKKLETDYCGSREKKGVDSIFDRIFQTATLGFSYDERRLPSIS